MNAQTALNQTATSHRNIIVIGASAGGVEALSAFVAGLPADFPAAIFIVLHLAAFQKSLLPDILARKGELPVCHALHGEPIKMGQIYIAPPDMHLTIHNGTVAVMRGPKENGHRPAVDPLFRTAARAYGPRVIGVILTGALDCGVAGMMKIKASGGTAVVQDPDEAYCPDMPVNALRHVVVDHIVGIKELAPLLIKLVAVPVAMQEFEAVNASLSTPQGKATFLVCPACQGSLTETEESGLLSFSCHVGHRFSLDAILGEQSDALESALWASIRALEESAALAERIAGRSTPELSARFNEKARTMRNQGQLITDFLLKADSLSPSRTIEPEKINPED